MSYNFKHKVLTLRFTLEKGKEFVRRYGFKVETEERTYKGNKYLHVSVKGTEHDIARAMRISALL